jgi:hypothetical protein
MNNREYMTFDQWWHGVGSGVRANINDDMETHARHVASIAWKSAQSVLRHALNERKHG